MPPPFRRSAASGAARSRRRLRALPWLAASLIILLVVVAPALGFLSLMRGGAEFLSLSESQRAALAETATLVGGVVALAGLTGLVTAWLVAVYDFPLRRVLGAALVLPLAFPTYLAAFVAVDFLDFFGPVQSAWRALSGARTRGDYAFPEVRSLGGAIILLALVLYPYIYVSCRLVFEQGGRNVIDAARMLGARGPRLFFRVGLPLARPAVIAGSILVILETLNDIGAAEHLGVSSLSVVIRDLWLNRGNLPGAARLAGLLLIGVALLLALQRHAAARAPASPPRAGGRARPIRLSGPAALAASLVTGLPVLLGFALPSAFLIALTLNDRRRVAIDAGFPDAALTSFALALAVAAAAGLLGAILAIAIRIVPKLKLAERLATFGYAVPGTVLVLSLFPVLRVTDDALALIGAPLAVSGTKAAILIALTIRFAGIGTTQASLALSRVSPSVDWVARVHGMSDARLALRIHLPAMAPGLVMGATLVFIDTIKELPATVLLRPLNFETLATRAYAQASAGTFENAALDSLAILALSGCAALLLARRH